MEIRKGAGAQVMLQVSLGAATKGQKAQVLASLL